MSEVFDAHAETYRETVQRSIAFSGIDHDVFLRAKVAALAAIFAERLAGPPALIDVGCGTGAMHEHMGGIAARLAGTDPSPAALARAEADNPAAEYRPMRDGALPWESGSFDAATAICVFHHVEPAERAALAAEMARVTRPGGLVAIIEHNPLNPLTRLAVARCPFDDDAVLLGARETRRLLAGAGLARVETRHFLFVPSGWRHMPKLERPLRRLPAGAQYLTFGTVR